MEHLTADMPMTDIPAHIPDAELVEGIRVDDVEAFQTLYYRYYDALVRFLRVRLYDTESACDLVQEVFTRLWQRREHLDPAQSVRAYLYRTAHHLAVDYLRRHRLEQAYHAEQAIDAPSTTQPDDAFELREKLDAAIRALPDVLRLVFILNRFEHCTYNDIADILGISVKAVEKRMSRALRLLRDTLRPLLTAVLVSSFFA